MSRVLNGTGTVREPTARRVLEAARLLGFRADAAARALAGRGSGTILLVVPDIRNPFFPELARGVEDAARERGYVVVLANSDHRAEREADWLEALRRHRMDGAVVVPSRASGRPWTGAEVPVVFADRVPRGRQYGVTVDQEAAAMAVVRHLVAGGRRRLLHLAGPARLPTAESRRKGFERAVREAGVEGRVVRGRFSMEFGLQAARRALVGGAPWRPDAVFCASDVIALGVLRACRDLGVRVPEDVAVAGFDDIALASMVTPGLTTVRQSPYHLGALACRLLLDRLAGDGAAPRVELLPWQLVVRESTAGRPGAERRVGTGPQALTGRGDR